MNADYIGDRGKGGAMGWLGRPLFVLIYLAAFALAAWRFWCSEMHLDYAVCGLLGLAMSRGEFPFFFYGQDFMGSLDGLLTMPLYLIFGPSTLALNFWPPVLWLGIIALMHRLLSVIFRPVGVWAGVALLAVPPAMLLCWAGQAQTHYPLGLFLCALLMLITTRLWKQKYWVGMRPFAWGLVAGLAIWTNFQTAVVVLPCGLFLLFTRWRSLLTISLGWMALGAVIGAGPLLAYNLSHDWPHLAQGGSFSIDMVSGRLGPLLANAIPLILGLNPFWADGRLVWGDPWFGVFLGMLFLMAWAKLGLFCHGFSASQRIYWLPLLVGALNVLVLLFSSYGRLLGNPDQRYFLPLYLVLPFMWAWLAQTVGRRRAWVGIALVLVLMAVNLGFYTSNVYCGREIACRSGGYYQRQEPAVKKFVAGLRQRGWDAGYSANSLIFSFLSGDDPVFAHPWDDRRATAASLVDAASEPVFVLPMARSLDFMGVAYQRCPDSECLWELYHTFAEPAQAGALVDAGLATARTISGRKLGQALVDADLGTGFVTPGPARAGQGVVLDLGKERELSGLSLVAADSLSTPAGLKLELAGKSGKYTLIRRGEDLWRTPFYWSGPHPFLKARLGRVDVYFKPQKARYIRLSHVGGSEGGWSLAEVLLFAPGAAPEGSWAKSGKALAGLARQNKWKRILADAWAAAYLRTQGIAERRVPISNMGQDDYGSQAKSLPLFLPISAGQNSALVVNTREAGRTAQLLNEAGLAYERHGSGRLTAFALGGLSAPKPLPIRAVRSNVDKKDAAALAAGNKISGRWASLAPQKPGVRLDVDLGEPRMIGGFELGCPDHPRDYPQGLDALVSDDGVKWRAVPMRRVWPLAFSGQLPMAVPGPLSRYRLAKPVRARFLRLALNASHEVWWWSVQRLAVFGP